MSVPHITEKSSISSCATFILSTHICRQRRMMKTDVEEGYILEEGTQLTVLRTSIFLAGDGFCVYDCKGKLVYRVDSYGYDVRDRDELVLMDASGECLLTVKRKVRSVATGLCLIFLVV